MTRCHHRLKTMEHLKILHRRLAGKKAKLADKVRLIIELKQHYDFPPIGTVVFFNVQPGLVKPQEALVHFGRHADF